MAIEGFPPALPLLLAALLVPITPLLVRRALTVLAPAVALLGMHGLRGGESWSIGFLGFELVLARADALSNVFGLIFAVIASLGALYGWQRARRTEQVASLLYVAGGLAVVFAGDLLTMLMAWEIMAVASTFLVFLGGRTTSVPAGQRYLLVHLTAGGLLLLGVLMLIHTTGSTRFESLNGLGTGAWLVLIAFCINAAVPPLHAWLPDAYPEAGISGSVFLSAFTTKSAVYCLLRAFVGADVLMWAGAVMAVYGVIFAVLENNMRRLLSYHIVSQVGYMVCGVGVGTATALNGSAAHAFCHILYKALLFMGVGAVIHSSGKERLSDLGGLARQMPLSLILYMVGAFSISGVPLFNGFISKSLVTTGAAEAGQGLVVLLLNLASVGTFLSVAIKLPYFAWFGSNGETRAGEAPLHMLVAMAITAVFCVGLGVAPHWLYVRLPYPPVHYEPYTAAHVFEALLLLSFTGVGFWWLRERLQPHRGITLDTDWFYRWPAARFVQAVSSPLEKAMVGLGERAAALVSLASQLARNPTLAARRLLRGESAFRAKRAGQATSGWDTLPPYDEDRQRLPIGVWLLSIGGVFVFLALALMFSTHGD